MTESFYNDVFLNKKHFERGALIEIHKMRDLKQWNYRI
jgi:hypothetical protein